MKKHELLVNTTRGRKKDVIKEITKLDPNMSLDPEGNDVIFWVTTSLSTRQIRKIEYVEDTFLSNRWEE